MKLRNKKTGEIGYLDNYGTTYYVDVKKTYKYIHKADLFDEWEECKDKEVFLFIAYDGKIHKDFNDGSEWIEELKEIGNYFETKEQAEKAVEKLKAWKRLKENIIDHVLKYEFDELTEDIHANISFSVESYPSVGNDLDSLFSQEGD